MIHETNTIYIGAEAGVYALATTIKYNGQESSKVNSTNGGVAPKVGLLLALGNLGIFAEGAYNIIFGNKDGSANVGGLNNVNFNNTSKFFYREYWRPDRYSLEQITRGTPSLPGSGLPVLN